MNPRQESKPAKRPVRSAGDKPAPGMLSKLAQLTPAFWLVIGLATVIRCWGIWNQSVEHFDEGVYASNIWFGPDQGYEYPARFFYAPPLWPLVLEWTQLIGAMLGLGHPGWLVMLPGILCGIALCGVIYSFGKEFFCEQVGLIAGLMAACSDLLASYSRTGLTDIPVTLCMLLAVRAMIRSLTTPAQKTSPGDPSSLREAGPLSDGASNTQAGCHWRFSWRLSLPAGSSNAMSCRLRGCRR